MTASLLSPKSTQQDYTSKDFSVTIVVFDKATRKVSNTVIDLGRRIREEREDRGMMATVLAERAGTTKQQIWRIESGRSRPSWELLERIAQVLDVEVADLVRERSVDAPLDAAHSPLMHLPQVQVWLARQGHKTADQFIKQLVEISSRDEVNESIDELRRMREELQLALKYRQTQKLLFPVDMTGKTYEERMQAALAPAKKAGELKSEIRTEYLVRMYILEHVGRAIEADQLLSEEDIKHEYEVALG